VRELLPVFTCDGLLPLLLMQSLDSPFEWNLPVGFYSSSSFKFIVGDVEDKVIIEQVIFLLLGGAD
jgi:hypothetical protein